ncbi:MAG: hypothetical protein IJC69_07690 [Clostridia bacterium]|nr:hypothetical protein [Clostridia bacterium]
MKLKRFLALAVSLAMVLTMVPAFSLTASAEETVLFDVDTITGSGEQEISVAGWTKTENGAAVRWNQNWGAEATGVWGSTGTYALMFFFSNGRNTSDGNVTAAINNAAATSGATKVIVDFNFATQEKDNIYQTWTFFDADGNDYARLAFDRNNTVRLGNGDVAAHSGSGTAAVYGFRGTNIKIETIKNATDYTINYYVAGELLTSETVANANGFGGIKSFHGKWNDQYGAAGLQDLVITYEVPASVKVVEAEYTANGEVVKTASNSYDTTAADGVVFPAFAYSANGSNVMYATDGATLSESGEIEMTAVANTGTHAVGDIFAKDGVQYEIKGANLIPNGDFAYGTTGWYNAAGGAASFFTSNGDGSMTLTAGGTGAGGANSLYRAWAIEKEKTYLFTFDASVANGYDKVSVKDDISATADGTIILNGAAAGTNTVIFTAANDYIQVNFRWLGVGNTFGNFGLYEIAEAEVAVQETVASVAEIAPVKVIGDTAVVLPSTVAVTGSLGTEVDAPIVWDAPASYTTGTTTVEGVATVQFGTQDATTQAVSTTVTVLEETFTLADITTVNGQDAGKASQVAFPVAIADEFSMEFVATYASFGDLWITIKTKDAGFFSPEQIPLGVNANGAFRPVNGNGAGGRTVADSDLAYLTAGTPYRFFITTDASTDKYTVTIYDVATGAEVVTAENFGYRTNADAIECITSLTNNGAGSVTLTDIKVNANVEKTEYTFNITLDGGTTTTTGSYWSDEEAIASVADIEGYEKTVTIDGTTVTVVYSATKVVTVTFVTADETVVYAVTEEVELDESVTVAEKEIYDAVTCAYYTIPEIVAETSTVVEVAANTDKIAVVADAFHNAGDAQPWNNDENMLFVGSAGVTNTDDVDANGENVTNKTDGGNLGSARVALVKFPVPEVSENQAVKLHVYAAKANQNLGNGNWMKIAANVSEVEANETENAFVAGDLANLDGIVWSDTAASAKADPVDGRMAVDEWMEIDVTNFVKAATGETITFALYAPTAGFYVVDREKAVAGGAYEGKAAYLTLEDAFVVTETGYATLTKNGSAMETAYVVAGDDVRLVADGAIVVGTDAGYVEANVNLNLTEAAAFENTVPASLGLAMVGGAQVRIGSTELEADAKLDALADSGLRFLATADYADTVLADEEVEFGIKVQAEASDAVAYVKAETFQNEDNNVFSAAITNMKESNYNRKYTAVAYALVPMADGTVKEFTTDSVTRSIYQVSAGIMKNGTADADNAAYTVDGVVKNILNAYVNQTGIRLSYTADGITVEEGKYTGDVFFTVESTVNADGSVAVTITPDASWGTPAEIASWWTDYVRVNNNNSVAKTYISDAAVDEAGVLTFTFTVPAE